MCGICITTALQRWAGPIAKQQMIVFLGVDETSEWCNRFVLVPKPNGKVLLCIDPTRLTKHSSGQYTGTQY